ncbi:MAG: sensor histidine kinase [Brevundimonas sp.]
MSLLHPKSLKGWLVTRLALAQWVILAIFIVLNAAVASFFWLSGSISEGVYELNTAEALAGAVHRGSDGALATRSTPALERLRAEDPHFWFIVRARNGEVISEGAPPLQVAAALPDMDLVTNARLGDSADVAKPALALVRWIETDAGEVQAITGGGGRITVLQVARVLMRPALLHTLIISGVVAGVLFLVTPFVVRRALRGLDRAAAEARRIDIDRSGARLSTDAVPVEILPFVRTINEALERLDKGYEGRKRFLADAAHELRTPIAILTTRLSSLPPGQMRHRLLEDAARLTALTDQLLDLQRLEQGNAAFVEVDLVALAERAVLDIAPLAFGAGYEMAFLPAEEPVRTQGDPVSIERALTNLLQNAIEYGGRRGVITVRVAAGGWIEVADEGSGVPDAERENIFQPFRRLRQDGRGAGLGLDLVRRVMAFHGGQAALLPTDGRGGCFRLVFPAVARS